MAAIGARVGRRTHRTTGPSLWLMRDVVLAMSACTVIGVVFGAVLVSVL